MSVFTDLQSHDPHVIPKHLCVDVFGQYVRLIPSSWYLDYFDDALRHFVLQP